MSPVWPVAGAVITKHRFACVKPSLGPNGASNTAAAEQIHWTFLGGRDEGSFGSPGWDHGTFILSLDST